MWREEVSFDADTADPLAPWLGSGSLRDERPSIHLPDDAIQIQAAGEVAPAVAPSGLGQAAKDTGRPVVRASAPMRVTPTYPSQPAPMAQNPLRRSTRGWQPSAAALRGIANSSAQAVEEVDAMFAANDEFGLETLWQLEHAFDHAFVARDEDIPRSFKHIQTFPPLEREKWLAACRSESASHLAIPSIGKILAPSDWTSAAPIRLTWVFARKPTGDFKARIVMLGQHMQAGVHFNDTHAPVPTATVVRLLLAMTAAEGRDFTQLDVKTAFLTAPIDIELDVLLPEGFGTGEDDDHHMYGTPATRRRRALTAIPGCPQGSRVWREKLVVDLNSLASRCSCQRSHVFLRTTKEGNRSS